MKYFTRYLPVEENGDENCKWQWNNNIQNIGWEDIYRSDMDAIIAHGLNPTPEFRKLKLFLFSWEDEKGVWIGTLNKPRLIGEISPEATWVKEGDEFDEEDVRIINFSEQRRSWTPELPEVRVKIKCSNCKKFH